MTNLALRRPLVSVDLETTGGSPIVDRIVQIGVVKLAPDGKRTKWGTIVNPEIPIPRESTRVHGITDEIAAEYPNFKYQAPRLAAAMADCDVCGFNVKFDIKFLISEFRRVRFPMPAGLLDGNVVDAMKIYHRMHPRDLAAAVEEYLGRKMEGHHNAEVDAEEALNVLEAQLARYPSMPRDPADLHVMLFETPKDGCVDADCKFCWRHGEAVFNFSKHIGTPLRLADKGMLNWILRGDFSRKVKEIAERALLGEYPKQ